MSERERRVICEQCGEIIETEPIGVPGTIGFELGDADRLIPFDECPFCASDNEEEAA